MAVRTGGTSPTTEHTTGPRRRRGFGAAAALVSVAALVGALLAAPSGAGASTTASISGTAWSATDGTPMAGVDVSLYEYGTVKFGGHRVSGPEYVTDVSTGADGTYSFTGLKPPTKPGYFVCFDVPVQAPSSVGVCWADQFWIDTFPDPLGFTQISGSPIKLPAGHHVSGIDADMVDPSAVNEQTAGSITGTVTKGGAHPKALPGVVVTAFNQSGRVFGQAVSGGDGSYEIDNLMAFSTPYLVCFDAASSAASAPHHFGRECYQEQPWDGTNAPSGATGVAVTAGQSTASIDANLPAPR
jgi:hypothetical protein